MGDSLRIFIAAFALTLVSSGCSQGMSTAKDTSLASVAGSVGTGTTSGDPASAEPIVAGAGASVAGKGALSVPTAEAVVARIQNGLQNSVSSVSGNFAKSLAQVKGNLPKVTDPVKATGYDQVQLLVYGACSDLTTGGTPLMQSKYGVNPKNTVAMNQAALLAAGMQIVDQYTAGLASGGPAKAQVSSALDGLVSQVSSVASNTSTIAFMAVCIAANTAGSMLLGF
jgi:hypothetical protein